MNKQGVVFGIFFAIVGGYLLAGGEKGAGDLKEPDPWQAAHSFVKRLDSGAITGEPIDPRRPPQLTIWLLTWGSAHLDAVADHINPTSAKVTLHGRKIKEPTGDARLFYPYARLEVSNETDRGWRFIGRSPEAGRGAESAAVMAPVVIGVATPEAQRNELCMIDMNPFRPLVGKFRYGRVVLKDGGASQTLVLNDLLPPQDAFR